MEFSGETFPPLEAYANDGATSPKLNDGLYLEEIMKDKNMSMITEAEECIGKYSTRKKAKEIAKLETQHTGRKHHEFLTHYHCPYDQVDRMCWTVLLSKKI